ncbi:hypothetical protein [Aestuariivirga sp.]|uniref:hypothetical protein n=1 Tax=Aestuariivirga sp. TaxID=2650926 RepID=UPI003BAD5A56
MTTHTASEQVRGILHFEIVTLEEALEIDPMVASPDAPTIAANTVVFGRNDTLGDYLLVRSGLQQCFVISEVSYVRLVAEDDVTNM